MKNHSFIKSLLILPFCFLPLTSCVDESLITFKTTQSVYNLNPGDEVDFLVFESEQKINKEIQWNTSNMNVAVIGENKIYAIDEGSAKLKVFSKEYESKKAEFTVNVNRLKYEKEFNEKGLYEIKSFEFEIDKDLVDKYSISKTSFDKAKVFYPSVLEESNENFPLILYSNGTNQTYENSVIEPIIDLFVSNGFIFIANNQKNDARGKATMACLESMLRFNGDKTSVFYNKVNEDKIGGMGYSQGASGIINTHMSFGELSTIIKSMIPLCPPSIGKAVYNGQYDTDILTKKFTIPTFIVSGTGTFDQSILNDEELNSMFEFCSNFSVKGRIKRVDHEFKKALPYMYAWFLYTLYGNEDASKIFTGESPEFLNNNRFIEKEIKNSIL